MPDASRPGVPSGPAAVVRWAVGAMGVLLMVFGAYVLLTDAHIHDPVDVLIWLAGAIAVHDALLAPLVLGVGLTLGVAVRRASHRRLISGALVVAGCLTLVALPALLRVGRPANPTVLPLDYLANWLLLLAGIAASTFTVLVVANRLHKPGRPPHPGRRGGHDGSVSGGGAR